MDPDSDEAKFPLPPGEFRGVAPQEQPPELDEGDDELLDSIWDSLDDEGQSDDSGDAA